MLEKEEIAPGIVVYSNVMENHETFIPDFEEAMGSGLAGLQWQEPHILRDGKDVVDHQYRNLETFGIPYAGVMKREDNLESPLETFRTIVANRLYLAMNHVEQDYLAMYGVSTATHDMYNVLKYGKGHFFVNHVDDNQTFQRTVSSIFYVNDNYEGGEIEFPRFGIKLKPKANQMLLFPSTYVYNHQVHEVTDGYRYAVVSWMN